MTRSLPGRLTAVEGVDGDRPITAIHVELKEKVDGLLERASGL